MNDSNYKDFWKFIKLLQENELLQHIVVIGSWAEYLYHQSGILPGFSANLRTLDIDFLVKNMNRPTIPVNIETLAMAEGYTIDHDVLNGSSKIYTPNLFEIEFIIEQRGSGNSPTIQTNLGVNAQALRHLSPITSNTTTLTVLGFPIIVPIPEAYVAHKIIINPNRGVKVEKDRQSIFSLMPFIDKEKFNIVCNGLTKKEQRLIFDFMQKNQLSWE